MTIGYHYNASNPLDLEAYLRDISGSVPDHCNKASQTDFLVSQGI